MQAVGLSFINKTYENWFPYFNIPISLSYFPIVACNIAAISSLRFLS
jgi:hypothetical protein